MSQSNFIQNIAWFPGASHADLSLSKKRVGPSFLLQHTLPNSIHAKKQNKNHVSNIYCDTALQGPAIVKVTAGPWNTV